MKHLLFLSSISTIFFLVHSMERVPNIDPVKYQINILRTEISSLNREEKELALSDFFEVLNHYASLSITSQDFIKDNTLFGLKQLCETKNCRLLKKIAAASRNLSFENDAVTNLANSITDKLHEIRGKDHPHYLKAKEFSDTLETIQENIRLKRQKLAEEKKFFRTIINL